MPFAGSRVIESHEYYGDAGVKTQGGKDIRYLIKKQNAARNSGNECMIGQIMLFVGNFAPRGWKFCDGSLMEMTDSMALYSIINDKYGGEYPKFALPNLPPIKVKNGSYGEEVSLRYIICVDGVFPSMS